MKHNYIIMLIIMAILFVSFDVRADTCGKSELNDLKNSAKKLEIKYKVKDLSKYKTLRVKTDTTKYKIPKYSFTIYINHIPKNSYITIKDSVSGEIKTIPNEEIKSNKYSFKDNDFGIIHKYTVEIYSDEGNCKGEKVGRKTFIRPRYNAYSEYEYCKRSNKSFCQELINVDTGFKNEKDFYKAIGVNAGETIEVLTIGQMLRKNKTVYTISAIVSFVVALVLLIIIRRNKKGVESW